ncbi:Uncharacterised protein [Morganella morganii]|nr:Uncharacterised protein [Morganella morganii]
MLKWDHIEYCTIFQARVLKGYVKIREKRKKKEKRGMWRGKLFARATGCG